MIQLDLRRKRRLLPAWQWARYVFPPPIEFDVSGPRSATP
jgi:hypothetical protein